MQQLRRSFAALLTWLEGSAFVVTPGSSMMIAAQKGHEAPVSGRAPEAVGRHTPIGSQSVATFTFPNRILFEWGARRLLATEVARLGITRPLVVTDQGLMASGLSSTVAGSLGKHIRFFSDVAANPTEDDVLAGLDAYREGGCDGLVAIGGGSAIDAAKAIRLLVTHSGQLADYDLTRGGLEKITASLPLLMAAVPTTAGTGSGVGRRKR